VVAAGIALAWQRTPATARRLLVTLFQRLRS